MQVLQRGIHGREVLANDRFSSFAVGLLDRVLDGGDCLITRQHSADGEEAGLHDGVNAPAHARCARHFYRVNHVEAQFLLQDCLLCGARKIVPNLVRTERTVEKEDRPGLGCLQNVEALHETELMAGHEIRS